MMSDETTETDNPEKEVATMDIWPSLPDPRHLSPPSTLTENEHADDLPDERPADVQTILIPKSVRADRLEQTAIFELVPSWISEWKDMPEYVHKDLTPFKSVIVSFATREHMDAFAAMIKQKITMETKTVWFPKNEITSCMDKRWVDTDAL